jgi:ribonuclease HI
MIYIYCDGASRGNPGPASIGVWAGRNKTETLFEISKSIGNATNNVAEWKALIAGLEEARNRGESKVTVFMDSELVVRQVQGRYKVKHPNMIPLHQEFLALKVFFQIFEISHILRAQNSKADSLANQALDKKV